LKKPFSGFDHTLRIPYAPFNHRIHNTGWSHSIYKVLNRFLTSLNRSSQCLSDFAMNRSLSLPSTFLKPIDAKAAWLGLAWLGLAWLGLAWLL
jgi:hypothetical protein